MKYLSNGFSANMVDPSITKFALDARRIEREEIPQDAQSCIGHQDLAAILGVEFNRCNLVLKPGDTLFVAQYRGPRLPEGATEMPEGSTIEFWEYKLTA